MNSVLEDIRLELSEGTMLGRNGEYAGHGNKELEMSDIVAAKMAANKTITSTDDAGNAEE